ncbi:tyrosinase family oxidase copper chaperone [Streptomyces phaeochromogenes]|uniref:tyrosinase family oxidase copper chaperone n=1 Tax=Streptomyces phaeochromogenes TaxID=1923 RepID=UPI0006E20873|nr:tyrosinase family oxidase copper chaperone [Streptomyces phaeochromogenes]
MAVANGTRRDVLRGLLVAAVTAALAPLVAASRPSGPSSAEPPASGEQAGSEAEFDEMYRGRRIRGSKDATGVEAAVAGAAPAGQWLVSVDDRPLHLMRRADGGYLTMVDHYQSYPTPLAAARGAVDELGGTLRLRAAAAEAGPGEGHGHGVHA